jgi:hypothetical protein
MAVDIPVVWDVVERVCTRSDALGACKRRDLGAVITVLSSQGVTQGELSVLTGIPQGRLSEYKTNRGQILVFAAGARDGWFPG